MSENLSPNAMIPQYTIVSKIGSGGMGEVYRARDTRLDREVANKIVSHPFLVIQIVCNDSSRKARHLRVQPSKYSHRTASQAVNELS
jgi:eukaryotic-like serine/threonine-protein kinase